MSAGYSTDDHDVSYHTIPQDALPIVYGISAGSYWLHLKTAEQLARALYECPAFDVAKVYRLGGISEGSDEPEGLVALYDRHGRLVLMGTYIAGGLQWPTMPDGLTGTAARDHFTQEIEVLTDAAAEFLPAAKGAGGGTHPVP